MSYEESQPRVSGCSRSKKCTHIDLKNWKTDKKSVDMFRTQLTLYEKAFWQKS